MELLQIDKRCNIPKFDRIAPPDARVLRLATAIRSRYAVKQFCDLVHVKRDLQLDNALFPTYNKHNAARRLRILEGLKQSMIMKHLNQYLFAIDMENAAHGSLRVPSEVKKAVLRDSGLSKGQYDYHLREGKKFQRICGDFDGMLCFIFADQHNPFQVSVETYRAMNDQELQLFHGLLADDYTDAICTAGKAFQQSLVDRDSYYTWETRNLSNPIFELPEDDMLSFIRPVKSLPEDKYYALEFPDWPDPTLIPPSEGQCEYCSSPCSCNCYYSKLIDARPRIMLYPGKGLGLQATSEEPGAVVYQKNSLIGFLTGKLVPPNTLKIDRAVEFHRCQIDCDAEGNEFRLLNHACAKHAVARLAKKKVSGRFRLAVIAQRNVHNGAEITIVYRSGSHGYTCDGCKDTQ
jgi:hypothetical protein